MQDAEPNHAVARTWVLWSELYGKVERELGISEFEAKKALQPDLESLIIDTEFRHLHRTTHDAFAREGLVFPERYGGSSRLTNKGWRAIDRNGRLAGAAMSVRWDQVVQALSGPRPPPAPELAAARSLRRKPAGVNHEDADLPLVNEMRRLIEAGEAKSIWDAALVVAGRAAGKGSDQSRAKRLVGRYKKRFSSEHD